MNKLWKTERLDVSPNSPSAIFIFNHVYQTFTSLHLRKTTDDEQDKLDIVIYSISSDVYQLITEYNTFESSVNRHIEL